MEKLNKEKFLNKLTLIFLFLLPLSGIKFFHSRITTLILVLFIIILFVLTIIVKKESRKNVKYLFIYYFIVIIYLLINFFRSSYFETLIPNDYNIISEALTMVKLIMPITFLYSLYYQKISFKNYMFIIKSWIIIIGGSIILTNFFKIGLSSYSDEIIKYNIFEWKKGIYYLDTASKGFFTYANQVAAVLISLLIAIFCDFLNKKMNIFYIFILSIAMIMLGTRVSSLGGLLILIALFILYFVYSFLKKEKISNHIYLLLIPILLWILLLPISPFQNRSIELSKKISSEEVSLTISEKPDLNTIESVENKKKKDFVYHNYNPSYLPKVFFEEYYSINYDTDFWYDFLNKYNAEDMNYRLIEHSIIKRMIEINHQKSDVLFGISNVRIQNVVNLERDFLLHYYAFGIIGSIILLIIYVILLINSLYKVVVLQNFYSLLYATLISLFIFCSILTGNVINSLFPVLMFVFIISDFCVNKEF